MRGPPGPLRGQAPGSGSEQGPQGRVTDMHPSTRVCLFFPIAMAALLIAHFPGDWVAQAQMAPDVAAAELPDVTLQAASGPETGMAVEYNFSPPARTLSAPDVSSEDTFRPPRINPLAHEPDGGNRGTWDRPS